jgi:peroxiredoxin Q/BCP
MAPKKNAKKATPKKAAKKPAKKTAVKTAKKVSSAPKAVAKKTLAKRAAKAPPKKASPPAPKKAKPAPAAAAPSAPAPEPVVALPPPPTPDEVAAAAAATREAAKTAREARLVASAAPPKSIEAPVKEPANDTAVKPGDAAPDFALEADDDSTVRLQDLKGKKVVLYFYPRDQTPGCTKEAQDFSQLQHEFEAKNAVVLGVSTDDLHSHRKFKNTCDLSVKLLSDPGAVAHLAYGVWREKNMYGVKKLGTIRSTFLINEDGRIARVWPRVKVDDHALEVLNTL